MDEWRRANKPKQTTIKDAIQSKVDAAVPVKKFSDSIDAKEDHVYRMVTKEDFDNALKTGELKPGRSFDNGGTVNFSKEPIPVYGGTAYGSAGLLVEVPESELKDARYYTGSKDLYAESPQAVPLSSVSRAWGFQFGDKRGVKIADVTDDITKHAAVGQPKQTDTPAFKAWFGDSKVVDAEGKPLVVYHGTRRRFQVTSQLGSFSQKRHWLAWNWSLSDHITGNRWISMRI